MNQHLIAAETIIFMTNDKLTAEILSKLDVFFLMHDGVTCI